ncbi:hypothetical protein ACN47A_24690 [Myxococcus fulvus]|uniref:hypothetical protein n=1 Tax=Myxococcus fulvus TaxID=33 RepID=UPI003B9AA21C
MAFLSLSGIPLRLDAGSPVQYRQEPLGDFRRSAAGQLRSSVRGRKWTITGSTLPMPLEESSALRHLINGSGHSWSFENGSASSTGIAHSFMTGGAAPVLGLGKYGTGHLRCPPGGAIRWPILQSGDTVFTSTIAAWLRAPAVAGGAWAHHIIDVATDETWLNGAQWYVWPDVEGDTRVRIVLTPSYLEVSFQADGVGVLQVDDLVLLPYRVPSSWRAPWRDAGVPFGPLPRHSVTGTGIHEGPLTVFGQANDGTAAELWTEDGQYRVHESFEFELREA